MFECLECNEVFGEPVGVFGGRGELQGTACPCCGSECFEVVEDSQPDFIDIGELI